MKIRTLFGTVLILWGVSAGAFEIDRGISGSWYNPDQNGHGFSIEVLDNSQILVYWYFYTPYGDSAFALGVGTYNGNTAQIDLSYPDGMEFGVFAPEPDMYNWGSITMEFSSCSRGHVTYDSSLTFQDGEEFGSGNLPIQRLASIQGVPCPAGSGSTDQPTGAKGLYQGFIDSPFAGQQTVYGLITENNKAWFVQDPGGIYFGRISESGNQVSGSITAVAEIGYEFSNGNTSGTISINGEFESGDNINIRYSGVGESGSVSLLYDSRYERDATLTRARGNWSYSESGYSASLNVFSGGGFSGQNSSGCQYEGQISPIDRQNNAYSVTASMSRCSPCNGSYQGVATVLDGFKFGDDRSLIIGAENGRCALIQQFFK